MINTDLRKVLVGHTSRYSLVTATAKRARDIAEVAEESKTIITEKPVSIAIEEIVNGKFTILEPEEIRNI